MTLKLEIIQQLVDHGANLDEKTAEGRNILHYAVLGSKTEAVQFLLLKKAALATVADVQGNLPIHFVKKSSVLDLLLAATSEPNSTDSEGISNPTSGDIGNIDLANRRLQATGLRARNDLGATPLCVVLHHKWRRIDDEVVRLVDNMLKRCPDLATAFDNVGNTAMHYLALCSYHYDFNLVHLYRLIEMLKDCGCDINSRNVYGPSPLHLSNVEPAFHALLDSGADVNVVDNRGRSYRYYTMDSSLVELKKPANEKCGADLLVGILSCSAVRGP